MGKKVSGGDLGAQGKRDVHMFDPEILVLVTDEKHPLFDERVNLPVDEALVANMKFAPDGVPQGVIKPVVGRRNTETGKVEIVDGRQRVKAAREANKSLKKQGLELIRVPVLLQRGQDHKLMGLLISANHYHHDETPMGRAKKAQRYIDLGRDEEEVAVLLGVSPATVKNMLRLLDAPAAVRAAVDADKISASDGYKLSRLEPTEAREKLKELVEKAPRTPGKKRSKNAKKAREVMGTPEPAPPGLALAGGMATPDPSKKSVKKLEDAVAEAIAAWVEATWNEGNWNGAPSDIPILIRKGEWREHRDKKAG